MKFVKIPYLPENDALLCIAGNGISKYEKELNNLGISIVMSSDNPSVDAPIQNHADVSVNYMGNGKFFLDKSQSDLYEFLSENDADCSYITESADIKYPADCLLNCLNDNKAIFCNKDYISKDIYNYAKLNKYSIINVKQGYTKCSICPVAENAYITDDKSIYDALNLCGYDSLLVKKGSVALNGYGYGFIGGACGKISKDAIAFFGNIKLHDDYLLIKSFCDNYNVNLISLSNRNLEDIGSMIPIFEKE